MTKLTLIGLAVTLLAFASPAFATSNTTPGTQVANQSYRADRTYSSANSFSFGGSFEHEITTNLTEGGFFSGKRSKNGDSGTIVAFGASYLQFLKEKIQIGGEGRLVSNSFDSSTIIDAIGVLAYNLDNDLKNSIFGKAGVGIYSVPKTTGSGYDSQFGFFLGAGKRFTWLSNVSYTPELRLTKRGDIDMQVDIAFLNFSIFWN